MNTAIMVGILCFLVAAILVYSVSERTSNPKGGDTGQGKTNDSKVPTWLRREIGGCVDIFNAFLPAFIMVAIPIFIIWLLFMYSPWSTSRTYHAEKPAVVADNFLQPEQIGVSRSEKSVEQQGIISWRKPRGVVGGDPRLRSFSSTAIVHRNNARFMDFTVRFLKDGEVYESRFNWNKNEQYGTWNQDYPQDGGYWYLDQKTPSLFVGGVSDSSGIFIPMRLEL